MKKQKSKKKKLKKPSELQRLTLEVGQLKDSVKHLEGAIRDLLVEFKDVLLMFGAHGKVEAKGNLFGESLLD